MEGLKGKKVVIYSAAFKRKVVEEVNSGEISQSAAQRKYGIGGNMTVKKWLERSTKMERDKENRHEMVEKELVEIEKLKQEKRQLESALAKAHLKIMTLEALIEEVEEHYKEPIKKNINMEQLNDLNKADKKE
jgi:transposase-like protein